MWVSMDLSYPAYSSPRADSSSCRRLYVLPGLDAKVVSSLNSVGVREISRPFSHTL